MSRFALWLVPPPEAAAPLSTLINDLAGRFGGPRFAPHLTLISGIGGDERAVLEIFEGLILPPVEIALYEAVDTEAFYRCVVLRARETASLMAARKAAEKAFARLISAAPPFMPHLSLLYGDLAPDVRAEALRLIPALPITFAASGISLHPVDGPPEHWLTLAQKTL